MSMVTLTAPCRLCGGRQSQICFHKEGYSVVRCQQCGLIYLNHTPRLEDLRTLYSAEYFESSNKRKGYHDYQALETSLVITASVRLREISRFCPSGRLLEIGCAMGFFLRAAQQAGWEVQGVELSEYAAKVARERFALPVINGRLHDAQFPAATFDTVVMWDVIEHVQDPVSLVREVVRVLCPGGIVALSTGDVSSLLARLCGSRWHLYNLPEHLCFFSPATIARLFESVRLRIRRVHHRGAVYTLEYLAYRLKTVYSNSLTSWFFRSLHNTRAGRWGIWLNLWDIMTVFASKERAHG